MQSWKKRPFEIANLLNPAFCSVLLYESINQYSKRKSQGMPFALSCLILPTILHKQTRECLPKSTVAFLHPWFQKNGQVRIGFAQRVNYMIPYTKEAIIFGLQASIFDINENGNFIPGPQKLANINWDANSEAAECRDKAMFVGKWYSKLQDISALFIMWGVSL